MSDIKTTLIEYLKDNGVNVVDTMDVSHTRVSVLLYDSAIDSADVLSKLSKYDTVVIRDVKEETNNKSLVVYSYPYTSAGLYQSISDEDKAMFARHKKEIEDAYKTMGLK